MKEWLCEEDETPNEITVIVTDEQGKEQRITITKQDDWKKVLENLKGTFRKKGYTIQEVEIPDFVGKVETRKSGLKIKGKNAQGKDIVLDFMTDELKKALESGNYRYEVFTRDDEMELSAENLGSFIRVEQQADGRYIIRYAKDVTLTEVFHVEIENSYKPPEKPPEEPPEEPKEPPEEPKEPPEEPEVPPTPEFPPMPPSTPRSPQTGVEGIGLYALLALLSLAGLGLTHTKKERS